PAGTALLHPLGQVLNIGNVDSGILSSANAAVSEDYGYITSAVPSGTVYHMPIGTDLGSLGGLFSLQFSTGVALISNGLDEVAAPLYDSGVVGKTGKVTWAAWINRTNSGDVASQIIMGAVDLSTASTNGTVAGNLYLTVSTSNTVAVVGCMNNF